MSAASKTPLSRQPLYTARHFGSHEPRILLVSAGGTVGLFVGALLALGY
jgi:hypothetical protein